MSANKDASGNLGAPRALPVEPQAPQAAPRAPRAFDVSGEGHSVRGKQQVSIEETPDPGQNAEPGAQPLPGAPRFFTLASLFWGALALLATLYLADGAYTLVMSLQQKSPIFGQLALGLLGIVVAGVLVFLAREFLAILRMRRVAKLREEASALIRVPQMATMRDFITRLSAFYARDAEATAGRAEIARAFGEMHDPGTMLIIAERALFMPKDAAARATIAQAAQRVSVVTALSPRAIVDVVFVLVQSVALIRRLSEIYGGRASGLGLLRLSARVLSHLALTGGVAVADSFLSQIIGAGLAARLSAKLGEGVLNGVLTARVGIAAAELCRPLPYIENPPITLSEVVIITNKQS